MSTPKKSYSFYFNTSDWLASQAVREMSKAERGVFICLLALAWERENKLPASDEKVRRLAEMSAAEWAESGEILLEQFPLSDCKTYRFNKRLQLEVVKEQKKSEIATAKAEKRWGSPGNAAASKKNAAAPEKACRGYAQEQVQEQDTTDVVAPAPAADLPAPSEVRKTAARRLASDTGADTYLADASPLYKDEPLKAYYTELVKLLPGLDWGWYVAEMRLKAPTDALTAPQWRNWIINFVKNEGATYRRIVAPLPNQVASNAGFRVQSLGIPNKEDYLKPVTSHPAGQYAGNIK